MINLVYIILGWIFLNVVVKLFVNSIERVYKERIDSAVSMIPNLLSWSNLVRLIFIIFFLPVLFLSFLPKAIFPFVINELRSIRAMLFQNRRWETAWANRQVSWKFSFYLIKHPYIIFFTKKQLEKKLKPEGLWD